MTYEHAKRRCHVRSGIYRTSNPTRIYTAADLAEMPTEEMRRINADRVGKIVPNVYWKNHPVPLDDRVSDADKLCDDWEEYDPREQPDCSAFGEMPA